MKPRLPLTALLMPLFLLATPLLAAPGFPPGWGGGGRGVQDYDFGTDAIAGATGKLAAYVKAKAGAQANGFGTMTQCIKANNYIGQRLRFAARLKGVNASAVQLWMRVDGPRPTNGSLSPVLGFYNMSDRPITGSTDWQRAEIVLDVPNGSEVICYGFFLAGGRGEAWADGLSLTRVGREVPVSRVSPPLEPANLGFER